LEESKKLEEDWFRGLDFPPEIKLKRMSHIYVEEEVDESKHQHT